VRCPYCRLIMPDESVRCGRCGSVREDGRWVRRASGRTAAGGTSAGWTRPPPNAAPAVASPPAAPPGRAPTGGGSRGCVFALAGIGLAAVVLVVVVVAVLATRPPAPLPSPRWSAAYVETFEAACQATGASARYCRCAREETERRIPEDDMRRFQRLLANGRTLDPADRQTLREIEARCAD
jgi:hypothetical protein